MTFQTDTAEFDKAAATNGGLAKGTIVLTLRGEVAVEDLCVGDKVITRDVGAQPLRALELKTGESVIVAKDSVGVNCPSRDMRVALEQPFLIRDDAVLFSTARLMAPDTQSILDDTSLYRLVFDRDHVIYADGAEVAII